jgi:hypothetical protein
MINSTGDLRASRLLQSKETKMSKRIGWFAALGFCCLMTTLPTARAQRQIPREEAIVRTTYAKLAYAVKIGAIHEVLVKSRNPGLAELEDRLSAKELKFELSNFSSGPLTAIYKRNFADLVTKPAGEDVLDVGTGTYNFTEDVEEKREVRQTSETGAQANWSAGQNLAQDWNVPFEQMLPGTDAQNRTKYDRYASYRVTVSFEGRSRSYNAMFLFGSGDVPVLALDNVTNNSALTGLVDKSLYPAVLLESPVARKAGVADWLRSHQVRDPACRSGERQVCCDPGSLTCGVAAADISATLDKPISRSLRPSRTLSANARAGGSPRLLAVSARIPSPRIIVACEDYDFTRNGLLANHSGTEEHTSGSHSWHDQPVGSCAYTGPSQGPCTATVTAQSTGVSVSETGGVTAGICHVKNFNFVDGSAIGSSPTASTNAAAVIVSCTTGCNCTSTITFSGQNPTFPMPNLWNKNNPFAITCQARSATSGTPIIIDTTGRGFHLTSQQDGVMFDLAGTGRPIQISWTDGISGNAFLALDRNGNGVIDSGKELFGNYTDQPQSDDPNGFLALAVFDDPASGGNADGVIDQHDRIWPQLRAWIDENHDGVSQPDELYNLSDVGVYSISLRYTHLRRYDQYGNLFRYKGTLNPEGEPRRDRVDRVVYDVFLVTSPN